MDTYRHWLDVCGNLNLSKQEVLLWNLHYQMKQTICGMQFKWKGIIRLNVFKNRKQTQQRTERSAQTMRGSATIFKQIDERNKLLALNSESLLAGFSFCTLRNLDYQTACLVISVKTYCWHVSALEIHVRVLWDVWSNSGFWNILSQTFLFGWRIRCEIWSLLFTVCP